MITFQYVQVFVFCSEPIPCDARISNELDEHGAVHGRENGGYLIAAEPVNNLSSKKEL